MDDLDTADQPSDSEIEGTAGLASLLGVEPKQEAAPKTEPKATTTETAPHDEEEAPKADANEAPTDDDAEEVDLGEVKLKLPKDQAEAVRKAALRQADYTQKTMALAEQRRAVEAEVQRAQAERGQYAQGLAQLQQQIESAVQSGQVRPPDPALLESDPVSYLRQQDQWQRAQAAYAQAQQQRAQIEQQQQAERQQQHQSRLQAEQEQLLAKLPEWRDAGKAQTERAAIVEYLKGAGFSPEEIGKVDDHRGLLMAREAMLYRQMVKEQKSLAEKKVAAAPPKAIKPGTTQEASTQVNKSAVQRLKASGGRDMQAAGQALASLLYGA